MAIIAGAHAFSTWCQDMVPHHTPAETKKQQPIISLERVCVCVHAHVCCVCVCVSMHVYTCVCTCIHVYLHQNAVLSCSVVSGSVQYVYVTSPKCLKNCLLVLGRLSLCSCPLVVHWPQVFSPPSILVTLIRLKQACHCIKRRWEVSPAHFPWHCGRFWYEVT